MTDLHTRFGAWLEAGAEGEPSRDVALHASACPDCQPLMAAFDALATVDLTLAPPPPASADRGPRSFSPLARAGRLAVAAAATVLLGAIVAIGASRLPIDGTGEPTPAPTREEVLAGIDDAPSSPSASARPSPTRRPSPSPTPEATVTASLTATESAVAVAPSTPTPRPPTPRPPAPPPPPPPPPPPAPTVAPPPPPTSTPTPQPPGPIPQPTPVPTPVPEPTPTPTPTPTPPPNQ
jgi:hypothetical protein